MNTLGKSDDGKDVAIDLPKLIESRLLLVANSGGGKSWLIRRLLEQTHGDVQHIVLDVEGEFHTLRERFDYVLARPFEGDCVAHPKTAKLLAHKLLELNVSAIVDIYELKSHERMAFTRIFLDALTNAPKRLWHPALVIVDEAHVFCPQAGKSESAGAVIDLMTRGRKRGFCGVLATQRISKLHKDAAAEAAQQAAERAKGQTQALLTQISAAQGHAATLTSILEQIIATSEPPPPKIDLPSMPSPPPMVTEPDAAISPSAQKILTAIHNAYPVSLSYAAAATRAGVSRRSSAYRSYRAEVEKSGEIEILGDGKYRSLRGSIDGSSFDPGQTIAEFARKLPPSFAKMLQVIADQRGDALRREEIADLAGVSRTSSGLNAGLKELQSLALVEQRDDGFALTRDLVP